MNENEQYERVCKKEFAEIKELLLEINDRLFKGNGQPSYSVQLDRLNCFKKTACWFIGACTVVTLGLAARLVYVLITG